MSKSKPTPRTVRERALHEMYVQMAHEMAAARASIFNRSMERLALISPHGSVWPFVERFEQIWRAFGRPDV
jgi:hypothetical protein